MSPGAKQYQFLSKEINKGDNAQNLSCWDIFYHYNREFNAIATPIYNPETEEGSPNEKNFTAKHENVVAST